ncbi:membrane protein [Philodulcilactobacillus myokoensis]|uniref:Membrane protein n=1 Tax=Philodulcilactobacillus myokoensis TaxID=2929573 RepID=A0A9W6ETD6_9LACO|nr:MFS transporter [Philodulcilactobacillus myokoensis]GLB47600.1 membrane protein [Philodulcilactobacillus myokoensis]
MSVARSYKKVISLLMCSQAVYLSAMSVDMTITALVGTELAPSKIYATVPMVLISILSVIVAPQVPKVATKIGIKALFIIGGLIAALGGTSSWYSVTSHSFIFLCIGTSCVGIYQAIANYYRYVASDVSHGKEVRSISLILSAGVVAAIVGPALATWTSQIMMPVYAGAYLLVGFLGLCAMFINSFLPGHAINQTLDGSSNDEDSSQASVHVSFGSLLKRASFRNGGLICLCSCFSMALIMSGATIFMQDVLQSSPDQRMMGMQLHMIGMYLPVIMLLFVAKYLSTKVQILIALVIGIIATLVSVFNITNMTVMLTLLLIGVFWSFSYASGSALLTKSYASEERQSARGKGELFPVLGLALGSLLAGPFNQWITWTTQMEFVLVFILLVIVLIAVDWKKI